MNNIRKKIMYPSKCKDKLSKNELTNYRTIQNETQSLISIKENASEIDGELPVWQRVALGTALS